MKLFSQIREMVEDEDAFICVLMGVFLSCSGGVAAKLLMLDEVESLTAARSAAMAGTEPSDSIRVVNSLLTQVC